ncbi:16S rRNA (adenine(1518)-N(6)/adenine(1519)-N(6))-dimethyltransferase [Candidatus Pantoea edessiphila]|uniref:Ribosomal RNA small subunit methyltransferase A n=1 Tax=Candidatus Pantoea edessiphila TaxID=2044610 RepID=A0A2P5T236_9GAMM|nr:16S rRNA (adenine(1518)-N(6)/adenine(1519)-N(6))-dimethyltransferase RsmA [Candidatus Pantoea edessiphila]PPI88638.1 16S rRNA (adenine(1518)-N(6)/adenine(1519)-N(6))-dimethyltransferase [Candidatus Pantoea edessiphila]
MNNFIYKGHCVRKRFGQNFLNNNSIINEIVSAINPKNDQILIEIGPGLGILTEQICKYTDKLIVIELDDILATRLKQNPIFSSKLTIFKQDAMKFDFESFSFKEKKLLRIFGNLPYNISTKLIFHLFNYVSFIKDMHFMLQKEVVNRMATCPGNRTYGRLSVMTQYHCEVIPLLAVNSKFFTPTPKVDSMFVRLVPFKNRPHSIVNNINLLNYVTNIAFSKRRKILANSLDTVIPISVFKELSIDPTLRPENISVSQYCDLANWLSNNLKNTGAVNE